MLKAKMPTDPNRRADGRRHMQVIRSTLVALMAVVVMAAFLLDTVTYGATSLHDPDRIIRMIKDGMPPRAELY